MNDRFNGKSCAILMATYNDWKSVAHIIPILDQGLAELGIEGRVFVVDDGSINLDGLGEIGDLGLTAIQRIDRLLLGSNQGNQRAMAIGLAYIAANFECDYLVTMDSDNEDKPEDVPRLLTACGAEDDLKVIFAERSKRSEGWAFTFLYGIYRLLYMLCTGRSISVGNFGVIPGHYIRRLSYVAEMWSHFPASIMRSNVPWVRIPTERGKRVYGKGSMNVVRLVIHAFSGFSVFADVMAVRMIIFATLMGGVTLLFLLITSLIKIVTGAEVLIPGWTSLMMMSIFNLFVLVLGTALIVLVLVLSMRNQPSLIPFHDHVRFIYRQEQLFPSTEI